MKSDTRGRAGVAASEDDEPVNGRVPGLKRVLRTLPGAAAEHNGTLPEYACRGPESGDAPAGPRQAANAGQLKAGERQRPRPPPPPRPPTCVGPPPH